MPRRKYLVVIGTRPEAIKMAPVVRALSRRSRSVETVVVSTGQHREMLAGMFSLFGIRPGFDLDLMRPDQTLAGLTAAAVQGFETVLAAGPVDAVLVQGDTTTAMACALAGFYRRIPVGHVEAGLRTGDRYRPFPEEINRSIISSLATWHFAPTERARRALLQQGIPAADIHMTGNTVIDALLEVLSRPEDPGEAPPYPSSGRRLLLVTAHRRESFGKPFEDLCLALKSVAENNPDVEIVYPVHLNPRVQEPVRRLLGGLDRIHLIPPLGYLPFARLMKRAALILTDSGGIQEEAPALGVPVLVMREETERPEAVEAGVARLVGTDPARIVPEADRLLQDERQRLLLAGGASPFGDGRAGERIAEILAGQPDDLAVS